jgi:hypothetical protein
VSFKETGRGVGATRDIAKDELFLRVPLDACIYRQLYDNTPLGPLIKDMDNYYGLIWGLTFERLKGNSSKFAPFIDIIPKQFTTTDTWTHDELAELQDSPFAYDAKMQKSGIYDLFNTGMDRMFKLNISIPENLKFSTYSWATKAVRTRCFEVNSTFDHVMVRVNAA